MKRVRVKKPHVATYADPIQVRAGTRVRVGREDDAFPGWKWCHAPDGREGWVPDSLLSGSGAEAVVTEDYSAAELSVEAGEVLEADRVLNGWLHVRNACGASGWIPERHVSFE